MNEIQKGGEDMGIKKCREVAGLRQEDVAVKLNIDRSAVAKWETGAAMQRADKLTELAKVLGCTIDELMKADD